MDSNKIKVIIILTLSAFVALYLGVSAATAQFQTILWIVGSLALATCLLLGKRIFLIIPFLSSLNLVLPLPGNFTTELIAQGIFIGFATLMFLSRNLPFRARFTELEFWAFVMVGTVIQAYLRNPVGFNTLGSGSVGAKPYFTFAIATVSSLILAQMVIQPKDLKTWVRLSFIGYIGNFAIGFAAWLFPQAGYYLGASFAADTEDRGDGTTASRVAFVRKLAFGLAVWVSSRISPLRALFHPLWGILVLISLGFAAGSGYRSQIVLVGFVYVIGICYRGGIRGVFLATVVGALGLALLTFLNIVAPLPLNVQRSLSFLPGSWDSQIKKEGENSTDWRVEMWKEALLSERWIQNKTFGDGLGFTKEELNQMETFNEEKTSLATGRSGLTLQQESMMINGGYHSGPVHTIRATGYVGLALLLIAMIRLSVHAHRQIKRCRGTEWHWVSLFIGIPVIVTPFFWTLVFGTFEGGMISLMSGIAIIRLLETNLPLQQSGKPFQSDFLKNTPQNSP